MDTNLLNTTAKKLVDSGKGILAADESDGTIKKRFDSIGVESSGENHRLYRQLLFKTQNIEKYISGVILFDETVRQSTDEGISFVEYLKNKGIIPGIKVDKGVKEISDGSPEKITEGIDDLSERLSEYRSLGLMFAKWRAVITIDENATSQGIPTDECIIKNAELLSKYARIVQEHDMVPIVEPEVLMDGSHGIEKCEEVTYRTLKAVFNELSKNEVLISGMLLKPNMVISGKESARKADAIEVAKFTLRCFKEVVPKELPGIVFLSGGQSPEEATRNLDQINKFGFYSELSFSYGRALQEPVLKAWLGKPENVVKAQKEFLKRAKLNSLARGGKYSPEMESDL